MRKRCSGKYKSHRSYTERGITCDPVWEASYDAFLADMGECPEGLTLERKDNSQGYSNGNCVWADYPTQLNNTTRNVHVTYNGEALTVGQWASRLGINYDTLWYRLFRARWPVDRALGFTT
jgi:hypothetical protein